MCVCKKPGGLVCAAALEMNPPLPRRARAGSAAPALAGALRARRQGLSWLAPGLSLAVRWPAGSAQDALRTLKQELDAVQQHLGHSQALAQSRLYWVGAAAPLMLEALYVRLREAFQLQAHAVTVLECGMGAVQRGMLVALAALPGAALQVQLRGRSLTRTPALLRRCQRLAEASGLGGVGWSVRLGQGMEAALLQAVRIHRPQRLQLALCPSATAGCGHGADLCARLQDEGYVALGAAQFAWPDDALAVAKRQGRLHAGVHGLSVHPYVDALALGPGTIGHMATHHYVNDTGRRYALALARGDLPVQGCVALHRDDLVRRAVLTELQCQGAVQVESIELAYLLQFERYFAAELQQVQALVSQGLAQWNHETLAAQGCARIGQLMRVFHRHGTASAISAAPALATSS